MAKCNKIIGKPGTAMDYYKKAIDKNPNDYTSLYELGINFYELKEYERAIYYFNKFILLRPNSFIGNHYLGLGYYSQEMLDSAITYFKKAIEINPDFIPSLNSLSACYYSQKNYDPAVLVLCKSLQLDSSNAAAHRRLGDCLYALEKYPEACVSYENAKSYGDTSAILINNLGWSFYKCQQYDSATFYLRWLVNDEPKDWERRMNLAGVLFKTSKFKEAETEFQICSDLLEKNVVPNIPDVYTRLGICLHQQKKYDEAITKYKRAIEIKPDFSLAFYNLAVTLDVLDKNKKEAIKTYEKFLDMNKGNNVFQEYKSEAKERIKLLKSK
jgi:tetratricopeptide (TPR) repeat protein